MNGNNDNNNILNNDILNNNNNNQNPNINNNNPAQQNNNGLQPVKIHMIQVSNPDNNGGSYTSAGDSIETNNSIAIWYALKTTMDYLQRRSNLKETFKQKLDPLVKQNLESISSYLNTLDIKIEDIDNLAKAFDEPANDIEINNEINNVLNNPQDKGKSIENLVFDRLIKAETDKSDDIIDNKDNKEKILLVKKDFDVLKKNIQKNVDNDIIGNNDIIDDDDIIDVARPRNQKVFLSKAAKEFQNKVKDLKLVKEGNEQDDKRKNYNEAVKNLDDAIFNAMKKHLERFQYNNHDDKVKTHEIQQQLNNGELFKSFGFKKEPPQVPQQQEFIKVNADIDYFKGILEQIKNKLINANKGNRKEWVQELDGEQSGITNALLAWDKCLNKLDGNDKNIVRENGMELKNNQQPGNLNNDLKGISNDKDIEKITLEYDEYNDFVAKTLFDNPDKIENTMSKLLKNLLLENPKDEECKKAKGQLKGMIEFVNSNFKPGEGKSLISRLPLNQNVNNVKNKDIKTFVPTFIEQLFNVNSGEKLDNFNKNLKTLGDDKDFQGFLSNIMKDDCAVDMIKNNFEQIEKDFKDAGYKATRRGKFKEEFWDNNLKGHLPFVGKWSDGGWKKNFAMLSGESLGGFALGSAFAAKLGLSLAGGILPAIGAAAVILVTAIAIAVLVSLMIALFKGFRDMKKGGGFYNPTENDKDSKQSSQTAYLNRIYTAFLTFGANEKELQQLVKDSQNADKSQRKKFEKSSRGKFFKSMVDMKDFLQQNAVEYDATKVLLNQDPFKKLKKILEEKNQEPPQNQNNEDINVG